MAKHSAFILILALILAAGCSGRDVAPAAGVAQEPAIAAPETGETATAPEQEPTKAAAVAADAEEVAPDVATAEPDAAIVCDGRPTPSNPEGPFYTPDTPERASLIEQGMAGEPITISGRVLDTDCQPVAGAMVDFWQTDAAGDYDNVGYRLRGHQFTDEEGRYSLETIIPGQYPGRPAHIHLKIFTPDGREVLTSQLYIPGISENVPDGFFDRALLVRLNAVEGEMQQGFFDFVVR